MQQNWVILGDIQSDFVGLFWFLQVTLKIHGLQNQSTAIYISEVHGELHCMNYIAFIPQPWPCAFRFSKAPRLRSQPLRMLKESPELSELSELSELNEPHELNESPLNESQLP